MNWKFKHFVILALIFVCWPIALIVWALADDD